MGKHNKPRAGSKAYSPRVRAKKETPSIRNYASGKDAVPLGFLCYKAGMTHFIARDMNKNNPTHNMDLQVPVTVLDCPPLMVFGIRAYVKGYKSFDVFAEVLSEKLDKDLARVISLPKESKNAEGIKKIEQNIDKIFEIVLLIHTQPRKTGFKKKTPEIIELPVGGDVKAQWAYAKSMLGKEINIKDVFAESDVLDVMAVTKGKGFQGPVKRWGIKIQKRKHMRSGHMRHVGSVGPWSPSVLRWITPQAGRMGYHRRTEVNKIIMKIGDKGDEINPTGAFVNYGLLSGPYMLVKGSVPGSKKRAVALRKSIRVQKKPTGLAIEQISIASKQGT